MIFLKLLSMENLIRKGNEIIPKESEKNNYFMSE